MATRPASPEPMLPEPYRVVSNELETPDTHTLIFEHTGGADLEFSPGQFMMVYVWGVGEVPISIAGNPRQKSVVEHTVRAVGAVTDAICGLEVDDVVGLRGPYGTSWPLDEAVGKDLLIIPGGIGLAPLRPAIIEALARRDEFNSISLLYGARTPADLLYKEDLLGWESATSIDVEVTVDHATSNWWGDVGLVTSLLPRTRYVPEETVAFVCGPEVMMRAVARELRGDGVPADDVWISMERNMKCGIGLCGHCQYGATFLCWGGPVGRYSSFANRMHVDEI